MRKSRFNKDQIIKILQENESGRKVPDSTAAFCLLSPPIPHIVSRRNECRRESASSCRDPL